MKENHKDFLIKRGYSKKKLGWDYKHQKQTQTTVPIESKGIGICFFKNGKRVNDPIFYDQPEAKQKISEVFKRAHPQDLQEILPLQIL